jgi:hypothetical protein
LGAFTVLAPSFRIIIVKLSDYRIRSNIYGAAGCLLLIALIFFFTNPLNSALLVMVFFVLVFWLLICSLNSIVLIQSGGLSKRSKRRVVLFSTFLTIFLMFSSTRSLNLTDIIIMFLILFGLYFYLEKN